ncbi:transcriptional regulator [Streptococcus pluranimalium]|uniref:transcriptional regulator n=1 Tax=Streptococcus pluranimalium TaxID=82348 RepID=UPI003F68CA44
MSNFGKGCLYIIICLSLFLGILKFILGEYLEMLLFPITLFSPILLLIILGITGNTLSELIKTGKWLGLGAIFGNIANNKINADASVKLNKEYKKKKIQTNHPIVDKTVEFISPASDTSEDDLMSYEEYQASQEFLKWKKMNSSNKEVE